jgi:hypothetical protein
VYQQKIVLRDRDAGDIERSGEGLRITEGIVKLGKERLRLLLGQHKANLSFILVVALPTDE